MTSQEDMIRKTERTTARRFAPRAKYERETVNAILDACLIAHVGSTHDGAPAVLPMAFWRSGEHVYFHGQRRNRMLTDLVSGNECCFVATLLDGLVLARRAIQHSVNYRCVIIYGKPEEIVLPEEKLGAMREGLFGRLYPGRWSEIRQPTETELAKLRVMRLRIDEASAKLREGPPYQQDEDVNAWAGVVPIITKVGTPIPDPITGDRIPVPDHATCVSTFLGMAKATKP